MLYAICDFSAAIDGRDYKAEKGQAFEAEPEHAEKLKQLGCAASRKPKTKEEEK